MKNQIAKQNDNNEWFQVSLTIHTDAGDYEVPYWTDGKGAAIVIGKDGIEAVGIERESFKKDRQRDSSYAGQNVPHGIQGYNYQERTYELPIWLDYLAKKFPAVRQAFTKTGINCLTGYLEGGVRGMLTKAIGMSEQEAASAVVMDAPRGLEILGSKIETEEEADAYDAVVDALVNSAKRNKIEIRKRLQAEKKVELLEGKLSDIEVRRVDTLIPDFEKETKTSHSTRTFQRLLNGYYKKDGISSSWNPDTGHVCRCAEKLFECYNTLDDNDYGQYKVLMFKSGKREEALNYIVGLYNKLKARIEQQNTTLFSFTKKK